MDFSLGGLKDMATGAFDKVKTPLKVAFPVAYYGTQWAKSAYDKVSDKLGGGGSSLSDEAKAAAAAAGGELGDLANQAKTDYANAINPSAYELPHYNDLRQQMMSMASTANRPAPQYAYGGNAFRAQQQQLAGALAQRAMGTGGPSAAELQMRAGLDQQTAQAHALAASARGMSPAMAMRQAMMQGQQAGLATNQQAGILRAQEQMNAQNTLGNVLFQGRTQDQTAEIANMDAKLRQAGLNDQQRMFALQQATGMDAHQLAAHMQLQSDRLAGLGAYYGMAGNAINAKYGMQQNAINLMQQQQARDDRWLGSALQTGGAIVGSVYGGPAGGAVGGIAGRAVADSFTSDQDNPYNQYAGYA